MAININLAQIISVESAIKRSKGGTNFLHIALFNVVAILILQILPRYQSQNRSKLLYNLYKEFKIFTWTTISSPYFKVFMSKWMLILKLNPVNLIKIPIFVQTVTKTIQRPWTYSHIHYFSVKKSLICFLLIW